MTRCPELGAAIGAGVAAAVGGGDARAASARHSSATAGTSRAADRALAKVTFIKSGFSLDAPGRLSGVGQYLIFWLQIDQSGANCARVCVHLAPFSA